MTVENEIADYLKLHGTAQLPGFGSLILKNAASFFNKETATLSPPGKQVGFISNEHISADVMTDAIAAGSSRNRYEVSLEVESLIKKWKQELAETGQASSVFGLFSLVNGQVVLHGNRIDGLHAGNYGLEEINLTHLSKETAEKTAYSFSKNKYWWLLALFPIGAIAYFGITDREAIFGIKSELEPAASAVKQVEKTPVTDSAATKITDSAHQDTLKPSAVPVKKYSSTANSYKYSKWKKAKRRRTHSRS